MNNLKVKLAIINAFNPNFIKFKCISITNFYVFFELIQFFLYKFSSNQEIFFSDLSILQFGKIKEKSIDY